MFTAFLANQLNPITTSKKSSSRRVTPRFSDPPAVSPIINSGLNNIEKIRIYKPHSNFTNEIVKIASAKVPQIKMEGGYCEIRNPDRRAMPVKKIRRIGVRTVFV